MILESQTCLAAIDVSTRYGLERRAPLGPTSESACMFRSWREEMFTITRRYGTQLAGRSEKQCSN